MQILITISFQTKQHEIALEIFFRRVFSEWVSVNLVNSVINTISKSGMVTRDNTYIYQEIHYQW